MIKILKEQDSSENSWKGLVRKEIGEIKPYIPGKPISEVKEEYNLDKVIKLASNENPLGVSPKVKKVLRKEIENINLYPDADSRALKEVLSEKLDIDREMITMGNGSDGLLKVIGESFLSKSDQVVISHPSFVEYKFVSQLMGCNIVRVCMRDYQTNLEGIMEAVTPNTKMIFLTNPDNPTGSTFNKEDLESFLNKLPANIIVILDEAYHEYVQSPEYPDGIELVKEGYPVIVLRTFSKAYGLAGLRLGYAISNPGIKDVLMRVRDPFNVNRLAEKAGIAALEDEEFLNQAIATNEAGKKYLYSQLERLGLDYVPTEANFILVNVRTDSMKLFNDLLKKGVIIRPGKPLGYSEHIRVTVGLPEENKEFIKALELTLD